MSVVVSSLMLRRYKPPTMPAVTKSKAMVEMADLKPAATAVKQLEGNVPRVSVV